MCLWLMSDEGFVFTVTLITVCHNKQPQAKLYLKFSSNLRLFKPFSH